MKLFPKTTKKCSEKRGTVLPPISCIQSVLLMLFWLKCMKKAQAQTDMKLERGVF